MREQLVRGCGGVLHAACDLVERDTARRRAVGVRRRAGRRAGRGRGGRRIGRRRGGGAGRGAGRTAR
ncbi:hypothetical protein DF163_21415 [Burkholderia stagnalis]|nr:hypothetical protein DF163_21415 [Burkholderia stagnalis]RQQ29448.1 hypothetical protein DF149_19795 [Burkholderia stagnalis]RQQ46485.1 hypothetical protein DF162_20520 [Burkholderia stagnalis]RQX96318.1 hypothetical protein DF119_20925 [Burkholderia stagnalis]RQY35261.1 hypothetical protein DF116_22120 [Burkholderia stagnalis]